MTTRTTAPAPTRTVALADSARILAAAHRTARLVPDPGQPALFDLPDPGAYRPTRPRSEALRLGAVLAAAAGRLPLALVVRAAA